PTSLKRGAVVRRRPCKTAMLLIDAASEFGDRARSGLRCQERTQVEAKRCALSNQSLVDIPLPARLRMLTSLKDKLDRRCSESTLGGSEVRGSVGVLCRARRMQTEARWTSLVGALGFV